MRLAPLSSKTPGQYSDLSDKTARYSLGTLSRVLAKGASAEVQVTLRSASFAGPAARALPIPLESFATNKDMGRILIRRGGETIGAGMP